MTTCFILRKLFLREMVPDLLYGDLPAELILRVQDDLTGGGSADQSDVMMTWVQNGVRRGMEGSKVLSSREKSTRFWSLSGMQTRELSQNGMPASSKVDVPHLMQNGIGSHSFGQDGMQPRNSTSGLLIRSYYTSEEEEGCRQREAGAVRMVGGSTTSISLSHSHTHTHSLSYTHTH